MSPKTQEKIFRLALLPLTAAVLVATGCTSSMTTATTQSSASSGPAFVVGTDAPLAAVSSFSVQVESVDAIPQGGGSPVPLMSGTPMVDFARFNGLQTLLDMNDVPAGTYTGVTITLASTGNIGYVNTGSGAPTIANLPATISPASTTITLSKPLVVGGTGSTPVGLRVDLDLAKSITVDGTGQITGAVTPTFNVNAVGNGDNGGYIDEFIAGVVSVSSQSFVVQGPHGENFTIDVNGQTEWDGSASLSALNTSSIVQVSGKMDPADQTLDADEVAVLSDKGFYATGQVTYVTPATGAATSFDLYVRGLEPTNTGISLGQIAQVNLTGSENYYIYWMHNPFTNFLFNSSALLAGQDVAVGGPASGAASASAVTVTRIHLREWGFNGTVVKGSQNSSQGSFQMQVTGFAGQLIPETVTVFLGANSDFRYGLGAFTDLTDGASIRVVGLLLKNPTNGQAVLLARHVDGVNFTDFSTFAF
jgi:hypothetical protein